MSSHVGHIVSKANRLARLIPDGLPVDASCGWLRKLSLPQVLVSHKRERLFPELDTAASAASSASSSDCPSINGLRRLSSGTDDQQLIVSTAERAYLELHELPSHENFDDADLLMEGLATLRPRRFLRLLGAERDIKVKRLFLADRHQHQWLVKDEFGKAGDDTRKAPVEKLRLCIR